MGKAEKWNTTNLVRIKSNANFLSRFQSVVTGVTKIDTSVGIGFFILKAKLKHMTCVTTLLALYSWKTPIKFNHDF